MYDIAIESMQAQIRSKFGQELDKLWQKVIDYRDTELRTETSFKIRYRKLREFFDLNVGRQFIDLTWKYCGLWINRLAYTEMWDGSFCNCSFISDGTQGREQSGMRQLDNMLNGGYIERYWNVNLPKILSAELLVKFATSYDKVKGAIGKKERDEIMKYVSCYIGFDIRMGFLMEDFLPKNSGVQNFTAAELTSLMLHEIGHTLTLIEHAADLYAHHSSFTFLTNEFARQNAGNPEEMFKLADIVANQADKNQMGGAAKNIRKLSNKVKNACAESGASADPTAKHHLLLGFGEILFATLGDIFRVTSHFLVGPATDLRFSAEDQKRKFGDLPLNGRYVTWQERKADEYAANHGYGADIVTALDKMNRMYSRLGKTPAQVDKINAIAKLGKDVSFFSKMRLLIYAPAILGCYGMTLYPEGIKRFRELLMVTVQMLKNNAADPEYVDFYLKQIETILDKIDHPDAGDEAQARIAKRYQLFVEYISLPSLFDALVHGRLKSEIEVLIDDVQKLSGNLLAYYGFKLNSLAKKG